MTTRIFLEDTSVDKNSMGILFDINNEPKNSTGTLLLVMISKRDSTGILLVFEMEVIISIGIFNDERTATSSALREENGAFEKGSKPSIMYL